MRGRIIEFAAAALLLGFLVALALTSISRAPSTYSTFDTGPNGYRALYEVLRRESVPVGRLEAPLAELPAQTRVLVATPALPAFGTAVPISYGEYDVARIKRFTAHGGEVIAFGSIPGLEHAKGVHVLDASDYTNAALARDPRGALTVYNLVAGRGPVVFDERLHGYDRSRTLWQVLPLSVRIATWLAVAAVILALVDANVRFAPPISIEPSDERDSSDYLRSMARLLRRARAGRAAIDRFARAYPDEREMQILLRTPSDAAVLRAAVIYNQRRKERR